MYVRYHNIVDLGKKCPAGYVGKYCETQCRFPNYGLFCQKPCLCPEVQCNFIFGCMNETQHVCIPYYMQFKKNIAYSKYINETHTADLPDLFCFTHRLCLQGTFHHRVNRPLQTMTQKRIQFVPTDYHLQTLLLQEPLTLVLKCVKC